MTYVLFHFPAHISKSGFFIRCIKVLQQFRFKQLENQIRSIFLDLFKSTLSFNDFSFIHFIWLHNLFSILLLAICLAPVCVVAFSNAPLFNLHFIAPLKKVLLSFVVCYTVCKVLLFNLSFFYSYVFYTFCNVAPLNRMKVACVCLNCLMNKDDLILIGLK